MRTIKKGKGSHIIMASGLNTLHRMLSTTDTLRNYLQEDIFWVCSSRAAKNIYVFQYRMIIKN